MINCNLLKPSFIWNFHKKGDTLKYAYMIKTSEMFSFLLLTNSSVTIGLSFLLLIILAIMSSKTIYILRFFPRLHSAKFL